jgi:hypothetical protein
LNDGVDVSVRVELCLQYTRPQRQGETYFFFLFRAAGVRGESGNDGSDGAMPPDERVRNIAGLRADVFGGRWAMTWSLRRELECSQYLQGCRQLVLKRVKISVIAVVR